MKKLAIEDMAVGLRGQHPRLDGLRIVQVSDVHCSGKPGRFLARVADDVGRLEPELLVFTGDAVNRKRAWPEVAKWLRDLPAADAKFAVPGNWDYHCGGLPAFEKAMDAAGYLALVNRNVRIHVRDTVLEVMGFDDVRYGQAKIPVGEAPAASGDFVLALCHSPDVLLRLHPSRFDLLLCGHTHGGQVRLPRFGAVFTSTRIGKRYEAGLYEPMPGHYVYVSRGLGEGPIKIRILCPAELARFTLRTIVP